MQLARLAGCAPIPVSSRCTDRHRPDRGGNRQLNHASHTRPRQTSREAIRCLKRHLARRIYHLLRDPNSVPIAIHCATP